EEKSIQDFFLNFCVRDRLGGNDIGKCKLKTDSFTERWGIGQNGHYRKTEDDMNSTMKFFTLILVLVASSVASFLLIFDQGLVGGLVIASLFLLVCLILFILSVYGVVTNRLEFIGF